jgi:hypothetical protein
MVALIANDFPARNDPSDTVIVRGITSDLAFGDGSLPASNEKLADREPKSADAAEAVSPRPVVVVVPVEIRRRFNRCTVFSILTEAWDTLKSALAVVPSSTKLMTEVRSFRCLSVPDRKTADSSLDMETKQGSLYLSFPVPLVRKRRKRFPGASLGCWKYRNILENRITAAINILAHSHDPCHFYERRSGVGVPKIRHQRLLYHK